VAGTATFLYC